jgi:predicted kinase
MREIAARRNVPFVILSLEAAPEVLRARVAARELEARDASEAGVPVLERQLATMEPLTPDERGGAIVVESGTPAAGDAAVEMLQSRLSQ